MKLITILIGILAAVSAFAATETHTVVLSGEWPGSVSFPKFETSNGTLNSATLSITTTNASSTSIENLSLAKKYVTYTGIVVDIPSIAHVESFHYWTNSLAKFDGINDYAGTSGVTNPQIVDVKSESITLDSLSVTGSGYFDLPLEAYTDAWISPSNSYSFFFTIKASIVLTVKYDFTPECPESVPVKEDRDRECRTEKRHR